MNKPKIHVYGVVFLLSLLLTPLTMANTFLVGEELQNFISLVKEQKKVTLTPLPNLDKAPLPTLPALTNSSFFANVLLNNGTKHRHSPNNKLQTKAIHLHYANVEYLANILQKGDLGLLSAQGKVSADNKNNLLWIRDHQGQISELSNMIRQYDQPMPQVFIKAKIVNVDQEYVHTLGIAFNSSNGVNESSGGIEELTIPIARLGHDVLLQATLDALEKTGHARMISNPQLITLNRQPATIEAGEEVPYQQSTYSGGTSVSFKKAVLSLQVTPEIMPQKRILLHLKINQDQVSSISVNGVPAITTQQIMTQVYVKDKSTVVLGGIFEQSNSQERGGVPGLGHMPLVGRLFRHQERIDNRKQLLIFVTPVIIYI